MKMYKVRINSFQVQTHLKKVNLSNKQLASKLMKVDISDDLEMFNDIYFLNWAWTHETADGPWKQFECLQCMVIETKFAQWLKDKKTTVTLKIGTIFFDRMVAEVIRQDGSVARSLKIMRTENNNRQRSNPENRHMDVGILAG